MPFVKILDLLGNPSYWWSLPSLLDLREKEGAVFFRFQDRQAAVGFSGVEFTFTYPTVDRGRADVKNIGQLAD